MGEKKYQVFISSTYDDLKDERKAVEEVVIRAGDIPVGMEAFPAADDEQFEFIKSIIDSCDYYLLLIAGRYGSVASDGLSYTEKEYDYAAAKGLPVLVMLRSELEQLTVSKSEKTERGKRALIAFIQKVSEKRLRKEWTSLDGLKLGVREALDHAKATKPRPGWVRGDKTASIDVLEELNELRKERAAAEKNAGPRISLEESELAGLETIISMSGTQKVRQQGYTNGRRVKWGAKKPLGDVFSFVAPDLRGDLIHNALNNRIAVFALGGVEADIQFYSDARVTQDDFNSILIQLEALGLLVTERKITSAGANAYFSKLTEKGKAAMYDMRVMRSER